MSKQRPGGRKRRTKVHRPRPVRRRSSAGHRGDDPTDLDLMRHVRDALAEPHPLRMLELASSLVSVTDPRGRDPFDRDAAPKVTLDELLRTFVEVDRPETTALLAVIAAMAADDLQPVRITRELAGRRHPLPSWLDHLDEARPDGTSEMVHLQRDGDNVMVGVVLPPSHAFTAVVYIDHNLGTLVKDAFVIPDSLTGSEAAFHHVNVRSGVATGMTIRPIDPADGRVRITDAINLGAMYLPPFETDTWPQCRPLVEWVTRLLPTGGTGYERVELSARDVRELVAGFFASPYAASLPTTDRQDHELLLGAVIDYSTDYGTGDPLHWSPVAVELILHWIPDKIVGPVAFLAKVPDLLRAYIRFCHAERRLPGNLTTESLQAVERWEPQYQQAIQRPQVPGSLAAQLAAMGIAVGPAAFGKPLDMADHWRNMIAGLEREVGGPEALARLDDEPLPDEPFDWTPVAESDRDRVAEVLDLVDGACDALLGVEHRTACRRFLAEVVDGDPTTLTKSANPAYPAAAVCWVIGKANDTFIARDATVRVKDLMAQLELTGSVSERGYGMVRASGRSYPRSAEEIELASPALLVAAHRREIIDRRDRFIARLTELETAADEG